MIEGITKYAENIQTIKEQGFDFYQDYNAENPINDSIIIPTNIPKINGTITGNDKNQLLFYIRRRANFGSNIFTNIDNLEFFQKVKKDVKELNKQGIFPNLGTDKIIEKVEVITDGYLDSSDVNSAIYQMELRVLYTQKNTGKRIYPDRF